MLGVCRRRSRTSSWWRDQQTDGSTVWPCVGGVRGVVHRPQLSCPLAEALAVGGDAFADVLDLMLIHQERRGGGDHIRAVLDPLMLLLAASAWERLWKSLYLCDTGTGPGQPLRLIERPPNKRNPKMGRGAPLLARVTGERLPRGFEVRDFGSASGRRHHERPGRTQ